MARMHTVVFIVCLAGGLGCQSDATMSWEEFRDATYREPSSKGLFVVDGDTPIATERELYGFYLRLYDAPDTGSVSSIQQSLAVMHKDGNDVIWTDGKELQLTYCISDEFGARKPEVVQAMGDASRAWANVVGVRYTYLPSADDDCTEAGAPNPDVAFEVTSVDYGAYLARAFFPNSDRDFRSVAIDDTALDFERDGATLTGILRHELGHTLGFRHEHTRPESGVCVEDDDWREVTEYDHASVMHYPQCNGIDSWVLDITDLDYQGAVALYGLSAHLIIATVI